MPTYQYRCTACGHELEAVQKFSDPALTECPVCGAALRKVFNAVGVVFKGSGFYRTDSRAGKDGAGATNGTKAPAKADAGTPAPSPESAPSSSGSEATAKGDRDSKPSAADSKKPVTAGAASSSTTS